MVTFVQPDWVEARIADGSHLVVDPRRRMRYLSGHLKNAISLPALGAFAAGGRLKSDHELAAWLGSSGVSSERPVIVYDSYDTQFGSMLVWALEYLGHRDVSYMEVSFDEWKRQGREVLYRPIGAESVGFEARPRSEVRAERADVQAGTAQILDVRTAEEYRGEDPASARPGHIPGAKHIPWLDFVSQQGTLFRDPSELRSVLGTASVDAEEPIIAYCRTGIRATVPYLALQRLGRTVEVYAGSFAEWISDPEASVETS
jgi:thiosulfate/3-mercaptopyruvate sulfurtransferase